MAADDQLAALRRWLAEERTRARIASQVTIRSRSTAVGERTGVAIDHLLVCELPRHGGWRITTKRTFLPEAHFSSWARHDLRTANHERGRVIYRMDRSRDDEVIAGIRYHVDDRAGWPLFLRIIGLRIDLDGSAELRRRTIAGAYVAKQYVHALASALGRPAALHVDLSPRQGEAAAAELGLSRARKIRGLRVGGVHMSQAPLA